jgi:osmotically-inducible protein OsmY
MRALFALCLLCLAPVFLAACSPVGIAVGGAAVAGTTALQERGFEQALSDKGTELSIQRRVIEADFDTFRRVDVSVVEGRVLLTGVVRSADDRLRAVQSSWQTDGVVEVINEIEVGEPADMVSSGYDLRIEKALELALTLDRDVQAVNYIADAANGTLYLIGIAQSRAELDRVIAHAREVERVRRVVSHVQLKESPERQAVLARLAELDAAAEPDDASDATPETAPAGGEDGGS